MEDIFVTEGRFPTKNKSYAQKGKNNKDNNGNNCSQHGIELVALNYPKFTKKYPKRQFWKHQTLAN
jgi:hypothetical protein